jgi:sigma-B regulation protein RsbU (phosphoserine phosphatase)
VRAGHEPAIFYDAAKDEFTELGGAGMALGVDENYSYNDYYKNDWHAGQIVLIGTDGIWETEDQRGERFEKERLREVLRRNSHNSAANIVQAVIDALTEFRGKATQKDDITLVVIKATA